MTVTTLTEVALLEERDVLVDALVAANDRLGALVAMLKASSDTLDLDEARRRMLVEALAVTASDAAVLDAGGGDVHRAQTGEDALAETHWQALEERLSTSAPGAGEQSGLCWAAAAFPGRADLGIVVGRRSGLPYTTGDLRMLEVVALAVEQLVDLVRLAEEHVRQTALEKEHELASQLAQAVLPLETPAVPGVDLFARCSPAATTGGDFLVFVETTEALWVAVGDVAGKGLPAAMIMIQAVASVRTAMSTGDPDDPSAALAAAGRDLQSYLESVGSFVTLAVVAHRTGSGTVALANAGHSPVVHLAGPGFPPVLLGPGAPPLGVVVPPSGCTVVLPAPPGARLVVGTDGLVEQPDRDGELLGYDAFVRCCGGPASTAAELGARIVAQVEEHGAGVPASDDRTLVVLQMTGDGRG